MDVAPREKFGLGSKLKKFVRNVIPNEIADIAVKAAPFVAPFNPALAAGMAGIGSFDQTGSISKGVRKAALNYAGGQLARFAGGAGFQGNPFKTVAQGGSGAFRGGLEGFKGGFGSPIGVDTGLKLGQYKMFGGQPAPEIEVISGNEMGSQFTEPTFGAGDALGGEGLTGTLEQATGSLNNAGVQTGAPKYTDLLKQVVSPDATLAERGSALKDLGGKALKDIYTDGDGKLDKSALFATFSGAASYIDALGLAEDAGITSDEYTEEMYEADKEQYKDRYDELLPDSAFGLKDGGRVKYADGTAPSGTFTLQDYVNLLNAKDDFDRLYDKGEKVVGEAGEFVKKVGDKEYDKLSKKELAEEKEIEDKLNELENKFIKSEEDYLKKARDLPEDEETMGAYARKIIDDLNKREEKLDELAGIAGLKNGGRVKYAFGSDPDMLEDGKNVGIPSITLQKKDDMAKGMDSLEDEMLMAGGITFSSSEKSYLFRKLAGAGGSDRSFTMPQLYGILNNPNSPGNINDAKVLKEIAVMGLGTGKKDGGRIGFLEGGSGNSKYNSMVTRMYIEAGGEEATGMTIDEFAEEYFKKFADGGRIGYAMGTEVPVRQNQGGITELDYRNTGGFVPIGVKERADDVPAMLSKNEFVFTADAVRGAGNGDINKGAQKMYKTMKQLEGKAVV